MQLFLAVHLSSVQGREACMELGQWIGTPAHRDTRTPAHRHTSAGTGHREKSPNSTAWLPSSKPPLGGSKPPPYSSPARGNGVARVLKCFLTSQSADINFSISPTAVSFPVIHLLYPPGIYCRVTNKSPSRAVCLEQQFDNIIVGGGGGINRIICYKVSR